MKYFNEDGVEVESELFNQEDFDNKIKESGVEAEEKHTAKIEEIEKAYKEQVERLKGERDNALSKKEDGVKKEEPSELEKFKQDLKEKGDRELKEGIDNLIEKKTGGNKELSEMIKVAMENFKDVDSVSGAESTIDNAVKLLKEDEDGAKLLDNINSGDDKGDNDKGSGDVKMPSAESMKMMGVTKEDYEKYGDSTK